jgi:deoxyribodipyrimidine photo-lyase
MTELTLPATRDAALDRLAEFVPRAGVQYASSRNTDRGPGQPCTVSRLSPYLRYRLITEQETIGQVASRHGQVAADKFVQEVLWRTYWKGWLEMRPAIWERFIEERDRQRQSLRDGSGLANAEAGSTGIEGFDDWARELVRTGYLHNHARMWFASIWIFTLRLPWALGADFFLRHLIDADPASKTLSWRWVAGLQTVGKTYLATADNISRYTDGRFAPKGLARKAVALTEHPFPPPLALPQVMAARLDEPSVLLVTHEDLSPESLFSHTSRFAVALVAAVPGLLWGEGARRFVGNAAVDTAARMNAHFKCPATAVDRLDAETLAAAARASDARQIVTAHAPVGPVADALVAIAPALAAEGITLAQVRRGWDHAFWPHAKKGFFAFKEHIPQNLRELGAV